MCLLQRGAVPIRGPESLPWVAEQVTQYGDVVLESKSGRSDVSLECYPTDKTGRHEG